MEPTWQKKKRQTAQRDELFSTSTHTAASFSSSRSPDQGAAVEFSSWNTGNYGRGGATGERTVDPEVVAQRRMVQRALQQHKSTTASAERSLQIAETCLDIGSATLEEVARQGESLDKAERGLELVCMLFCTHQFARMHEASLSHDVPLFDTNALYKVNS